MKIIYPNHRFKTVWDNVLVIATIAACIEAPLRATLHYAITPAVAAFDLLVTILFLADVVLNLMLAIPDGKSWITDRRDITRRYLRGWFTIDFLSAVPFDLILNCVPGVPKLLRLLALARMLRLARLAQFVKNVQSKSDVTPGILRMVNLVFWILLGSHFVACLWLLLGSGNSAGTSGSYAPDDNVRNYIRALYWVTTTLTTIGYGDIAPVTNIQTIFTMFIQLMGAGMYGFVIGNIANLIANLDIAKAQHREKMEKIATFMKYKRLPDQTRDRINDYYDYLWQTRRGYDEFSIVADFPKPLRSEVLTFLNREMIQKVPFFKGASQDFITEIVLHLRPVVYPPGSYVFKKGSVGHHMYFISHGTVEVVSEDGQTVYATLGAGNFFGEIALLLSQPRTASIRVGEYSDLYTLDKSTFEEVLQNHREFEAQIRQFAEKRQEEMKREAAKRAAQKPNS